MKHTWNEFRSKIKEMNQEEKENMLKQLHDDLIFAKTRRYHESDTMRCRMLRKRIAYLKTVMGVKGFSYTPRENI